MTSLFLTAKEVGGALGLSVTQVMRMLDSGELPWVTIGKRRRVPAAAFKAWVEARTADALSQQQSRKGLVFNARIHRQARG